MDNRLLYRRQFLLTRSPIGKLADWAYFNINDCYLYVHQDLEVTEVNDKFVHLILIGYIFDPNRPTKNNSEIVSDIILQCGNFEDLINALKPYAGRYALIYRDDNTFAVLHDPLGLREIYYCTQSNLVICGSQPNLLDAFAEPKLGITKDPDILHFYKHDMKYVRSGRLWVGDETYYHCVKHLMPNHFLNVGLLSEKRYWPSKKIEKIELSIAVEKSCEYLKGVIKAVCSRYNVMMAVTAGTDSRSLLAASREMRDQIYFFINKQPPLTDKSPDIRIPKNIFKSLNIPFHVHEIYGKVEEQFKNVFLNNTFMSTELILPTIYNVYFRDHQSKINLLGVGEIGREYYGKAPKEIDGYYLARCLKYKRSAYASKQCEKWLKEARIVSEKFNVDLMRIFLWEGLLANWGCVGNSESDIAIEEFDPYDSHYIYEIMLSVDPAKEDLFEGMFKKLWPELLNSPFNPPESIRDWIKLILHRAKIFRFLQRQMYRFDRWRYNRQG